MTRPRRAAGQLPAGAGDVDHLGQAQRAVERVVDRRGAGEERVGPRSGVDLPGPHDLAPLGLQREHPVDGPLDGRPEVLDEAPVLGDQPVVPHAGRDVGADVRVELRVLDRDGGAPRAVTATRRPLDVVVEPAAVGSLHLQQPLVRPLGLGEEAGGGQGHGRLHVVPRVAVATRVPGDHPAGELERGDGRRGLLHLLGGEDAVDVGDGRAADHAGGFLAYTTRLLPSTGLSAASGQRVTRGAFMMSHSNTFR